MPEHQVSLRQNQEKKKESHGHSEIKSERPSYGLLSSDIPPYDFGETSFGSAFERHIPRLLNASPEQLTTIFNKLQQTYGNRHVQRLVDLTRVQAKTTAEQMDDREKREPGSFTQGITDLARQTGQSNLDQQTYKVESHQNKNDSRVGQLLQREVGSNIGIVNDNRSGAIVSRTPGKHSPKKATDTNLAALKDPKQSSRIIFNQKVTLEEAAKYLWEGRPVPTPNALRPDPDEKPAPDHRQNRFLVDIEHLDVVFSMRAEVRGQYRPKIITAKTAPTPPLEEQLPTWLPSQVRNQILQLHRTNQFARDRLPQVRRFAGSEPWGAVILWVGIDEWKQTICEIYNYFPEDEEFYKKLRGVSQYQAHLMHHAYTQWNNDMGYFVEKRLMRPRDAREEIYRINTEVLRTMLGAIGAVFSGGSPINAMQSSASATSRALTSSRLAGRKILSIFARRKLPATVLYRGTTLRYLRGRSERVVHDLDVGTYFTDNPEVANLYANLRQTEKSAGSGIVLRAEVETEKLGRVLDFSQGPLRKQWDRLAAPVLKHIPKMSGEPYFGLFKGFLKSLGRKVEDFDTIIGPEYVRGGIQMNIRDEKVLDQILALAKEISK